MNRRTFLKGIVPTMMLGTVAARVVAADAKVKRLPDAVVAALDKAERIEVFALDPNRIPPGSTTRGGHAIQGYRVTGRATLTDAGARKDLVAALRKSVADSDGSIARCFNPRHGLRVGEGDGAVELVICFECLHLYAFVGGTRLDDVVPITASAQEAFDKALGAKKLGRRARCARGSTWVRNVTVPGIRRG
jgi:hypothetical protein